MSKKLWVNVLALLLLMTACRKANYPEPSKGTDAGALITRVKLNLMYETNFVPDKERHDIYNIETGSETGSKIGSKVTIQSIEEVEDYYDISIVEKSTTRAVILSVIKKDEIQWFAPEIKEEWIINDNEWVLSVSDSFSVFVSRRAVRCG